MTNNLLLFFLMFMIVFTGILLMYYTYKLVLIDAESRQMSKPKFWAFLAASSQNGSGLPIYLLKRKGTLSFLNAEDKKKVSSIKRKIYALLLFDLIIFLLAVIIL